MNCSGSLCKSSLLLLCCAMHCIAPSVATAAPVDFNREVRPILSAHCFACHGPDAAERQAELRLDTQEGALADLGGHAAIVPKDPQASTLLQRITSTDAEQIMPPTETGKQLTAAQIDTLRRWIAEGAKWQSHWAYEPPVRADLPRLAAAQNSPGAQAVPEPVNAIDGFIRARLPEAGLRPSPEADRVTLVRRLYFDLLGLPPSAAEVEAVLRDSSPQAYEKLVDQLLASPHFGERMAMYWLDVVRFADTNGFHGDNHRDIALYRDYVIDAFNQNKPFDRFTIEQLAGDLLADASRETRIASGYNHLLMTTREGGAQAKEYTAKYAADRVRNVSSAWLGATMGCAECHDHKFDPFATKDFYRLAAFFADIKETAVGVQEQIAMPDDAQTRELAELNSRIAGAQQVLDTPTPALAEEQQAWEEATRRHFAVWSPLVPTGMLTSSGAMLQNSSDGALLVAGEPAATDVYTIVSRVDLDQLTGIRLEAIPHATLPGQGAGRAANGNFVLSEIRCSLADAANPADAKPLELEEPSADFSQADLPVAAAIDGKGNTGWAVAPHTKDRHTAIFAVKGNPKARHAILTIEMSHRHGHAHTLGHFRLSITKSPRPLRIHDGLPAEVRESLALDPPNRGADQQQKLAAYFRTVSPTLEPARQQLKQLQQAKTELEKAVPTTLVSMSVSPRAMRVLPRGNWLSDAGELVEPGVPTFLPPLGVTDRRATRLDLAHWLVAPGNPLVARVYVNRLWKLVFGQGLVKTLDDFGSQGAAPSHPDLLDYLALEFVDSGWDTKHLLKMMVMSATYRQSSAGSEQARQIDPYNKWLARQSSMRLDAEMIRDNALAISGLLSTKIGGPSVKPYQPRGYWSHLNFPVREYEADHGESLYRRGLYTYWCRTYLHPSLLAFDAPTREECTVERSRSNTPLQALVLLNDPTYVEAARVFARRVMTEGGSDPTSRLRWAYRQAITREPTAAELEILSGLLARHQAQYAADAAAASELLGTGETPLDAGMDRAEWAAWTSVVRVLLNLHETITRT